MTKHLVTRADLFKIVSNAKQNMANISLPLYVSEKQVEQECIPTVAIMESVLMYLNSKNLLTNQVNLDYTDSSCFHDNELPLEEKKGTKNG